MSNNNYMNFIRLFKLRNQILRQLIFNLNTKIKYIYCKSFKRNPLLQELIENGFLHLENIVPKDFIDYIEKKYHKF